MMRPPTLGDTPMNVDIFVSIAMYSTFTFLGMVFTLFIACGILNAI